MKQSIFIEKFNHDSQAKGYDNCVKEEEHPIRAGYSRLLQWVSEKAAFSKYIVDLGCGTGNTVLKLNHDFERITCVDISDNMMDKAKEKLASKTNVSFIKADLLTFFEQNSKLIVDTVISTYAIHHLTQKEKHRLFKTIYEKLAINGKIIFGDLMFQNKDHEDQMKLKYPDLVEAFDDEFYWYVDDEVNALESLGFKVEIKSFSDLSWGIYGMK